MKNVSEKQLNKLDAYLRHFFKSEQAEYLVQTFNSANIDYVTGLTNNQKQNIIIKIVFTPMQLLEIDFTDQDEQVNLVLSVSQESIKNPGTKLGLLLVFPKSQDPALTHILSQVSSVIDNDSKTKISELKLSIQAQSVVKEQIQKEETNIQELFQDLQEYQDAFLAKLDGTLKKVIITKETIPLITELIKSFEDKQADFCYKAFYQMYSNLPTEVQEEDTYIIGCDTNLS